MRASETYFVDELQLIIQLTKIMQNEVNYFLLLFKNSSNSFSLKGLVK